jgi:GTPase SAR1 family protein
MAETPKFKVILVGDIVVGKTSIIKRYNTNLYDDSYQVGIYTDYCRN